MKDTLVAAILIGLTSQSTSNDEALRLTNVEIHLTKSGSGTNIRTEARISNPNDFAVFNVVAICDFKDRRGSVLASYTLTITDAVHANGTRFIRHIDMEAWPDQARKADCVSLEATRLPD
jgi:hypothetical protein